MKIQGISHISFQGKPNNYGIVNERLTRSAQPLPEDFSWLKDDGVTDVINLRTNTDTSILFDEATETKKLGMKYHNIAINHRNPTEKNIVDFLDLMKTVEKNKGKAHIHCLEGRDRTGLCAFIYKGIKGIGSVAENEAEWLKYGHNVERYPNLRNWAKTLLTKLKG
ncbi:tyrosine-protein phosphatase [bacterium]|nr:tyrosine-protein phosphatase [bacterium]